MNPTTAPVRPIALLAALAAAWLLARPAAAIDAETHRLARETQARAIAFLRSTQDPETGGWSINGDGPDLPAIAGLALTGLLLDPRVGQDDPAVRAGAAYVLGFARPDGGIHDGFLPTYNTAICVSALARVRTPEAASAVREAVGALRRAQWGAFDPELSPNPDAPGWTEPVDESHPYYGGVGYGRHGRPDGSNLQFFVQALRDAGVPSDDPAIRRALVFLRRTQMHEAVNPMPYADGSTQGGFVYATVPNAESVDSVPGQSQAGSFEETLSDGSTGVRLRAYGSMTYAGFKSLIFADLPRDDDRVTLALDWASRHWTLDENPGIGQQGYYYYVLSLARALEAFGADTLGVVGEDDTEREIDWRAELVRTLADLQQSDGSFEIRHERWLESNPDLITAYALIALGHAVP